MRRKRRKKKEAAGLSSESFSLVCRFTYKPYVHTRKLRGGTTSLSENPIAILAASQQCSWEHIGGCTYSLRVPEALICL
jgi:hypothetical protein